VLAGDIVDFLAESPFESFTRTQDAAVGKLKRIIDATSEVWDALASVVRHGCELTLVLGNHDIELAYPAAQKCLFERLGPGRVSLSVDGRPLRLGSTIVLHGNGDDAWNHVAYDRLNAFTSGQSAEVDDVAVVAASSSRRS
jgi:UDP-2,3-diacylglucosamine pyrophosphatase LpxH